MKKNVTVIFCNNCSNFYRMKCCNLKRVNSPLANDWQFIKCILYSLPFSSINDLLTYAAIKVNGFSTASAKKLCNLPSITIQNLLDQIPGQRFSTDEFFNPDSYPGGGYFYPCPTSLYAHIILIFPMYELHVTMLHLNIWMSGEDIYTKFQKLLSRMLDHIFDVEISRGYAVDFMIRNLGGQKSKFL